MTISISKDSTRSILSRLLGGLIMIGCLSACDINHLDSDVKGYEIKNGEMKERHEANLGKPFPNLGDVPERTFFDDTDDFDVGSSEPKKKTVDDSIEISSQYVQGTSNKGGPFSLVSVKKVTKHFLLADTVAFEGDDSDFLPHQKEQVLKFGQDVKKAEHKIVVIAKRNDSILGFDSLGQKRLKQVVRLLLSTGIRSDRLFYGYDDQVDSSYFPSLDRIQDNELKVFTR